MTVSAHPTPPPLLTRAEVGIQTNLTERQVAEHTRQGRLGCVRIGRVVRYTQAQVDAFIAACTVPASE